MWLFDSQSFAFCHDKFVNLGPAGWVGRLADLKRTFSSRSFARFNHDLFCSTDICVCSRHGCRLYPSLGSDMRV